MSGLVDADRKALLGVARRALHQAAAGGGVLTVDPRGFTAALQARRGCFVTLELEGALRGCVGVLSARHALVQEVAQAAHGAARRDPRFPPLELEVAPRTSVQISVLSPPTDLAFASEAELVAQLEPGRHGVILRDGGRVGTFLPAVWDTFEDRAEFFRQLKRKAGLPPDHFSATMAVQTYTAECFRD